MENTARKPLLILDLDETLIFGTETELHRKADFRVGPFHIYKRPKLDSFLLTVTRVYKVAIWSSASDDYVHGIAQYLLPLVGTWEFVWSRARCTQRLNAEDSQYDYLKDLRKVKRLGFDLDRTLIVDDTPRKVCRNYGNAVYISPFEGSADDIELPLLDQFVHSLLPFPNFRKLEKRGWRNRFINILNTDAQ